MNLIGDFLSELQTKNQRQQQDKRSQHWGQALAVVALGVGLAIIAIRLATAHLAGPPIDALDRWGFPTDPTLKREFALCYDGRAKMPRFLRVLPPPIRSRSQREQSNYAAQFLSLPTKKPAPHTRLPAP